MESDPLKEIFPKTYDLLKQEFAAYHFTMTPDERHAAHALEDAFIPNQKHYKEDGTHPWLRRDRGSLDSCVKDFKKLQHEVLSAKSVKVAAVGCIYLNDSYFNYMLFHSEYLGKTRTKRLSRLYEHAKEKLTKFSEKNIDTKNIEKQNAAHMINYAMQDMKNDMKVNAELKDQKQLGALAEKIFSKRPS